MGHLFETEFVCKEVILKFYGLILGALADCVVQCVREVVNLQLVKASDCSLASRFVPFDELSLVFRLLVQGPLIVPAQRILLIVLLGAVSDCSRIGG